MHWSSRSTKLTCSAKRTFRRGGKNISRRWDSRRHSLTKALLFRPLRLFTKTSWWHLDLVASICKEWALTWTSSSPSSSYRKTHEKAKVLPRVWWITAAIIRKSKSFVKLLIQLIDKMRKAKMWKETSLECKAMIAICRKKTERSSLTSSRYLMLSAGFSKKRARWDSSTWLASSIFLNLILKESLSRSKRGSKSLINKPKRPRIQARQIRILSKTQASRTKIRWNKWILLLSS